MKRTLDAQIQHSRARIYEFKKPYFAVAQLEERKTKLGVCQQGMADVIGMPAERLVSKARRELMFVIGSAQIHHRGFRDAWSIPEVIFVTSVEVRRGVQFLLENIIGNHRLLREPQIARIEGRATLKWWFVRTIERLDHRCAFR